MVQRISFSFFSPSTKHNEPGTTIMCMSKLTVEHKSEMKTGPVTFHCTRIARHADSVTVKALTKLTGTEQKTAKIADQTVNTLENSI